MANIKIMKDGPAVISGIIEAPIVILTHDDGKVEQTDNVFAICRCGKSSKQPFCDGSHTKV